MGRNLERCGGENLYKIGLIDGATVSFDIEEGNDMALNIRVENKPNRFLLAFLVSRGNLAAILSLLLCIWLTLLFKELAAYLVVGVLSLWVIKSCQDIYGYIRKIFD